MQQLMSSALRRAAPLGTELSTTMQGPSSVAMQQHNYERVPSQVRHSVVTVEVRGTGETVAIIK